MACHLQIYADLDPAYQCDADPNPAYHYDADPAPTFHLMRTGFGSTTVLTIGLNV
jgi:hypothetical protein